MADRLVEQLTAELKKLRTGTGLTPSKLNSTPELLALLGDGSAAKAYAALVALVRGLGESVPARALRAAYAMDFSEHPVTKTRRSHFGISIERYDQGTIIGYEDEAIADVAVLIVSPADLEYMAVCLARFVGTRLESIHHGRLKRELWEEITTFSERRLDVEVSSGLSLNAHLTEWRPQASERNALPLLLYRLPTDWKVYGVFLSAEFVDVEAMPAGALALSSPDLFGITTQQSTVPTSAEMGTNKVHSHENPKHPPLASSDGPGSFVFRWDDPQPGDYFALVMSGPRAG